MTESPETAENVVPPPPQRWFEMLAVLWLGYVPMMVTAVWFTSHHPSMSFAEGEILRTVLNLQILIPLLYILWRSHGGWAEFGIVKPDYVVDASSIKACGS